MKYMYIQPQTMKNVIRHIYHAKQTSEILNSCLSDFFHILQFNELDALKASVSVFSMFRKCLLFRF